MNIYTSATVIGLAGLIGMAALGLSHGHSPGGRGHGGRGHAAPPAHGHGSPGRGSHHAGSWLLGLTSPRVLLSLVLGFGLSGLLLTSIGGASALPATLILALAILGGLAFERLLILPYWNALMQFQSRPARSLGSAVLGRATAVTDFDASGSGLVVLDFEGEVRQVLATLAPGEQGVRVRRGDRLRIEGVDEGRNRCTVSSLS